MTRKMLIITTSERVKEVVHNIIKEKIWDLWVTGIIVVDKDMVGQQINDIPVVANRSTMFEYAVREVVDEVFISLYSYIYIIVNYYLFYLCIILKIICNQLKLVASHY